jgi:hypothetical protein
MKEIIVHVDANKKIINRDELKDFFHDFKVGATLLTAKDYRKRSNQQNRYYWVCVVPMVREGLYDAGFDEIRDDEDAHELLKQVILRRSITSTRTGDEIPITGSTQKLSIFEFNQYLEAVIKWAAEYLQIPIPAPSQQYAELAEYSESLENLIEDDNGITIQEGSENTSSSGPGPGEQPVE